MIDGFRIHRLDDADVIDDRCDIRQQFADPRTVFAVPREIENRRRAGQSSLAGRHRRDPLARADTLRQIFVEVVCQLGLVVVQVQLRRGVGHEQPDDPLRCGRMMQR